MKNYQCKISNYQLAMKNALVFGRDFQMIIVDTHVKSQKL